MSDHSDGIRILQELYIHKNQVLTYEILLEKFLSGDTCILYRNSLDFTIDDFRGKKDDSYESKIEELAYVEKS